MKPYHTTDPLEIALIKAFTAKEIDFVHESQDAEQTNALDFFLPKYNVFIEVCRFYSPRKIKQMERQDNVILIQGLEGVMAFVKLIG